MSQVNHNYSYVTEVDGLTVWERLRVIRNFLTDRRQALALAEMNLEKKEEEVANGDKWAKREWEIFKPQQLDLIEDCKAEIKFLEEFEAKLAVEAEPSRIPNKTDREMYELNFPLEARARLKAKAVSEIMTIGAPSPDTMRSLYRDTAVMEELAEKGLIGGHEQLLGFAQTPLLASMEKLIEAPVIEHISSEEDSTTVTQ